MYKDNSYRCLKQRKELVPENSAFCWVWDLNLGLNHSFMVSVISNNTPSALKNKWILKQYIASKLNFHLEMF